MGKKTKRFVDGCFRCGRPLTREEVVNVFSKTFCQQCAGYYSAFLTNNMWTANEVKWLLPSMEEVDRLENELKRTISEAKDEKPLQTYFEVNPSMLVQVFRYGHGRWVFPRPRLGSEHIPDFMICGLDSAGPHWHLIELENPTYSVLRKNGEPKSAFTHARQQIDDWRIWLRKNIQYAQSELGFTGLDTEFKATIVMGRRVDIKPVHQDRYRELSRDNVEVMSYDRLFEQATGAARAFRASVDNLLKQ